MRSVDDINFGATYIRSRKRYDLSAVIANAVLALPAMCRPCVSDCAPPALSYVETTLANARIAPYTASYAENQPFA